MAIAFALFAALTAGAPTLQFGPTWLACDFVVTHQSHAVIRGKPQAHTWSSKESQVYVFTPGNEPKLQYYEPFRKTVSYREKAVVEGGKLLIRDSINYPGRNGGSALRGATLRQIDLASLDFTDTGNGFSRDDKIGMTLRWKERGQGKCSVVEPGPLTTAPATQ